MTSPTSVFTCKTHLPPKKTPPQNQAVAVPKAKCPSSVTLPRPLLIDGVTYDWNKVLGIGGFGVAVSAKRRVNTAAAEDSHDQSPSVVAIKTINKRNLKEGDLRTVVQFAQREASILKALNHVNIIKLFAHWADESYIYMIMELCSNNNLSELIKSASTVLECAQIRQFFLEMALGCEHIHSHLVVHRDLKPDNILLTETYHVKIADFGLSVALKSPTELLRRFCGTVKYQAPEMLQRKPHSFSIDVWALGIILYRLYYGRAPFDGPTKEDIYKAVLVKAPKFTPVASKSGQPLARKEIAMMKKMLVKEPDKRIKVAELLQQYQPYLEGLNVEDEEHVQEEEQPEEQQATLTGVDKILASLEAISTFDPRKRIRLPLPYTNLHSAEQAPKYWITEWIESAQDGIGYLFNKNIFGFNFAQDHGHGQQKKMMLLDEQLVVMHYGGGQRPLRRFPVNSPPTRTQARNLETLKKYHSMLKGMIEQEGEKKEQMVDCLIPSEALNTDHPSLADLLWLDRMNTISESSDSADENRRGPVAIVFLFTSELIQLTFPQSECIFLFDGHQNAFSIVNQDGRLLCLDLQYILAGHITDEMQSYAAESLKYIRFFLDSYK